MSLFFLFTNYPRLPSIITKHFCMSFCVPTCILLSVSECFEQVIDGKSTGCAVVGATQLMQISWGSFFAFIPFFYVFAFVSECMCVTNSMISAFLFCSIYLAFQTLSRYHCRCPQAIERSTCRPLCLRKGIRGATLGKV